MGGWVGPLEGYNLVWYLYFPSVLVSAAALGEMLEANWIWAGTASRGWGECHGVVHSSLVLYFSYRCFSFERVFLDFG